MSSNCTSRSTSLDSSSKSLRVAEPNTSSRRTRYFLHSSMSCLTMAFEHVGHGHLRLYHCRADDSVRPPTQGPRRETELQGAVGPSPNRAWIASRLPSCARRCSRAGATPWRPQCWRRRHRKDGRRFVPPQERPSTGVAAGMGRERPRLADRHRRPGASGGVAHAPRAMSATGWDACANRRSFAPGDAPAFPDGTASPLASCSPAYSSLRRCGSTQRFSAQPALHPAPHDASGLTRKRVVIAIERWSPALSADWCNVTSLRARLSRSALGASRLRFAAARP